MEILLRNSCRPTIWVSMLSIAISPCGSISRKRTEIKDDFPAPVLPTIPTYIMVRNKRSLLSYYK